MEAFFLRRELGGLRDDDFLEMCRHLQHRIDFDLLQDQRDILITARKNFVLQVSGDRMEKIDIMYAVLIFDNSAYLI